MPLELIKAPRCVFRLYGGFDGEMQEVAFLKHPWIERGALYLYCKWNQQRIAILLSRYSLANSTARHALATIDSEGGGVLLNRLTQDFATRPGCLQTRFHIAIQDIENRLSLFGTNHIFTFARASNNIDQLPNHSKEQSNVYMIPSYRNKNQLKLMCKAMNIICGTIIL
ncbi:hypothetical protein LXL04_021059 [Taraxacum kok-saghyz]